MASAHQSVLAPEKGVPADLVPKQGSVAILPERANVQYFTEYILERVPNAEIGPLSEKTVGVIYVEVGKPASDALAEILDRYPQVQWVQLSQAGINNFVPIFEKHGKKVWTSAKGSFGQPVAEHALMLSLALLRNIPKRIRATSWATPSGISLFGLRVTIIGAGGITLSLISLLSPFGTPLTVLRRKAEPLDKSVLPANYADGTTKITVDSFKNLHNVLPETDVLFIAAALTPETQNMISEKELSLLPKHAVLVNVARGELVDTAALTKALKRGTIAGAGLDVTAPEPLPSDHELWSLTRDSDAAFDKELEPDSKGNLIITPHTADTPAMVTPLLAMRYAQNVKALVEGKGHFEGIVDVENGY